MTITYRQTKGSALLYGEVDENFRDLLEDTTLHRVLTNGNTSNLDMTVNNSFCNTLSTNSITTGTITVTSNLITINTIATNSVSTNSVTTGTLSITTNSVTIDIITSNVVSINTLTLTTASTPANSTANGSQGQVLWDADYIYVCVANNTWKRTAITTWI